MGIGLDTRSYLIQAPRPNGEFERAQLKVAFTKQTESFMSRFRPGQVDETEADTPGGGTEAEPRRAVPEMPDDLVFYSWWNEEVATPPELQRSATGHGVQKRLRLQFATATGTFRLFLDDVKVPVTIAIEHADGTPVCARELYIGKKLDILGRATTLRSAGAKTISWIDAEAKRLLRRREWVVSELSKFCEVSKLVRQLGFHQLYLNRQNAPQRVATAPIGGQADLQRLVEEIEALERQLRQYRR